MAQCRKLGVRAVCLIAAQLHARRDHRVQEAPCRCVSRSGPACVLLCIVCTLGACTLPIKRVIGMAKCRYSVLVFCTAEAKKHLATACAVHVRPCLCVLQSASVRYCGGKEVPRRQRRSYCVHKQSHRLMYTVVCSFLRHNNAPCRRMRCAGNVRAVCHIITAQGYVRRDCRLQEAPCRRARAQVQHQPKLFQTIPRSGIIKNQRFKGIRRRSCFIPSLIALTF